MKSTGKQLPLDWYVETEQQRGWRENEEKGLTRYGKSKAFDGVTKVFYLDDKAIACTVNYTMNIPHAEFMGQPRVPNYLTETGYYSHFSQQDFGDFATIEDLITRIVEYRIALNVRELARGKANKKARPYTLRFEATPQSGAKEEHGIYPDHDTV